MNVDKKIQHFWTLLLVNVFFEVPLKLLGVDNDLLY